MDAHKQSSDKMEHEAHLESLDNEKTSIEKAVDAGETVQMRSELDNLPPLKALRLYWRITLICLLAAFCAALEGYRTL